MKKTNGPQDLHVDEFVQLLSTLPADQPMTKAFEKAWAMERQRQTQDTGQWYHKQKEHVLEWFASQVTQGAGPTPELNQTPVPGPRTTVYSTQPCLCGSLKLSAKTRTSCRKQAKKPSRYRHAAELQQHEKSCPGPA